MWGTLRENLRLRRRVENLEGTCDDLQRTVRNLDHDLDDLHSYVKKVMGRATGGLRSDPKSAGETATSTEDIDERIREGRYP